MNFSPKAKKSLICIIYVGVILLQILFFTPYRKMVAFSNGRNDTIVTGFSSLHSVLTFYEEDGSKIYYMCIDYPIAIPQFLATTALAVLLYIRADGKLRYSHAEKLFVSLYNSLNDVDKAKAIVYLASLKNKNTE